MKLSSATEVGTQYQWSAQSNFFSSSATSEVCEHRWNRTDFFLVCGGKWQSYQVWASSRYILTEQFETTKLRKSCSNVYRQTIIDLRINFEHHALHLHLIKFVWLFLLTSSPFKSACMYISNESNCLINYVNNMWVRRKKRNMVYAKCSP